jgi:hypothetical protein
MLVPVPHPVYIRFSPFVISPPYTSPRMHLLTSFAISNTETTSALTKHVLSSRTAETLIASTRTLQSEQWSRIIARGERGELSRVYVVVKNDETASSGLH